MVYANSYVQCRSIFEDEKYEMNMVFIFVRKQSVPAHLKETPGSTRYGYKNSLLF